MDHQMALAQRLLGNPAVETMTHIALVVLGGLLWTCSAQAQANDARWPERPIRLIVPFTAGSSSDIVARLVAQKLCERLGQPLVVEKRATGGGRLRTGHGAPPGSARFTRR